MFVLDLLLGSWVTASLIALTIIILLYWYSNNKHDYWKKRGVPFDKPMPFLGSMLEIFRKSLHQIELDRYMKYGTIYGHFEGNRPMLSVADPALIRDILVKDFPAFCSRRDFRTGDKIVDSMLSVLKGDEDWKRIRSIITPTFSTGKIKRMIGIFCDCSQTIVENFRNLTNEGKPIDAKRLFGAFSMDVIASSAFSTKIDSHNDPDNQFVITAKAVFTKNLNWRFVLSFMAPRLVKRLGISIFPAQTRDFFQCATLQIIEERKRTGQTRNDFLQLLMDTAKEVSGNQKSEILEKDDITSNYGAHEDINSHILKTVTSKNLSQDELVAQCVIFFVAGYETTASTLSFASHVLATNPDIQDRARKEVDEAIKEANGKITYEAIQNMKYLDNIISETLRMYPPTARIERTAEYDYKLGDTGITIPKDMLVTIPVYALHRDPKLFLNPDKFNPNRFNPEKRGERDQYTYLPFGGGPRNCVAMRFALMEMKICLAHIVANFNIKKCSETQDPLEFVVGPGLLQAKTIILQMENREDSPLAK